MIEIVRDDRREAGGWGRIVVVARRDRSRAKGGEGERVFSIRIESWKSGLSPFPPFVFRPVYTSLKRDTGRRDKLDLMTVAKKRDMKVERAGRTDRIKF